MAIQLISELSAEVTTPKVTDLLLTEDFLTHKKISFANLTNGLVKIPDSGLPKEIAIMETPDKLDTDPLFVYDRITARLGIGIALPVATLDVAGDLKVSGLPAGSGTDFLVAMDATGVFKISARQEDALGPIGPVGPQGIPGVDGADGSNGANGLGWTSGAYDSGNGLVTFVSSDGLGFVTTDLRGADGADSVVPGPTGPQGVPGTPASWAGATIITPLNIGVLTGSVSLRITNLGIVHYSGFVKNSTGGAQGEDNGSWGPISTAPFVTGNGFYPLNSLEISTAGTIATMLSGAPLYLYPDGGTGEPRLQIVSIAPGIIAHFQGSYPTPSAFV